MPTFSEMKSNSLSLIDVRILNALLRHEDFSPYKEYKQALMTLKKLGYIDCIFDEQGGVITAKITPSGKKALSLQS